MAAVLSKSNYYFAAGFIKIYGIIILKLVFWMFAPPPRPLFLSIYMPYYCLEVLLGFISKNLFDENPYMLGEGMKLGEGISSERWIHFLGKSIFWENVIIM